MAIATADPAGALRADAPDPGLRDRGRAPVQGGADRRLLPPLLRPGGGDGRRDARPRRRATCSSPATAATASRSRAASPPEAVMAELFGRVDGCAHGRGGSMHLLDVGVGYYGGWGIVAGQLPIATGLALGARAPGAPAGGAVRARRRRGQHGRLARVAQPRRGLAAAGRLPRHEQRVRHGHERRARLGGDRALPPRRRLRPAVRAGRRRRPARGRAGHRDAARGGARGAPGRRCSSW